jgi:hypothetical protein
LLVGLAACPQFQSDDWHVPSNAPSLLEASTDADAFDSTASIEAEASATDEAVADTLGSTDGSVAVADVADGAPLDQIAVSDERRAGPEPNAEAGSALDSGARDASASDGSVGAQDLYCGLPTPRGIALFDGNVCWVEGASAHALFCGPTSGGVLTQISDQANDGAFLAGAFDLVLDATYVYWSNGKYNQVVRRLRSGAAQPQQYFTGGGRVSFLTFGAASHIWVTDFPDPSDPGASSAGEVIVGPALGGSASNAIYTGEPGAAGVAVYNANVCWGTPHGLAFGSLIGNGTITRIMTSPDMPVSGVAIDAQGTAYFLAGNQSLYRLVNLANAPERIFTETRAFGTGDVAVDDKYVYWSEPDLGCIKMIAK